jgi:triacylglycerol lipase
MLNVVLLCVAIMNVSLGFAQGGTPVVDTSGKTVHPIVLIHGMGGFKSALGADYYYGVKEALAEVGNHDVYNPNLGAAGSNEGLGDELIKFLDGVRRNNQKFNLIGHSQGGLVARYVMYKRPDLVASVATMGTPHKGSELADAVVNNVPGPAEAFGTALAAVLNTLSGNSAGMNDVQGIMGSLTTNGMDAFNSKYPAGVRTGVCNDAGSGQNDGDHEYNGIKLFSWGSYYNPLNPWHVSSLLTPDPADAALAIGSTVFNRQNDGFVARCSMHFGKVIGDDYIMNHADQINGMFGNKGWDATDAVELYVEHAKRLKGLSL